MGAKISDQELFLRFWENKNCSGPLSLHKPAVGVPEELAPSEINTITGATISSEAVLDTANRALERLRLLFKEEKLTHKEQNVR